MDKAFALIHRNPCCSANGTIRWSNSRAASNFPRRISVSTLFRSIHNWSKGKSLGCASWAASAYADKLSAKFPRPYDSAPRFTRSRSAIVASRCGVNKGDNIAETVLSPYRFLSLSDIKRISSGDGWSLDRQYCIAALRLSSTFAFNNCSASTRFLLSIACCSSSKVDLSSAGSGFESSRYHADDLSKAEYRR